MSSTRRHALVSLLTAGLLLTAACSKSPTESAAPAATSAATSATAPGAGPALDKEKVLNLYIWNDYLADDTIANFEKETGIKVSLSNYGSNEELDSKLAPGESGYDIVVPSASFFGRQIKAGYYRKLDRSLIPNFRNLDPEILRKLAENDPDNEHAVLHMWGVTGIGYNVAKVQAAMKDAPVDSWRLVMDPTVAKSLQKCGIAILDSASEMFKMTLAYMGRSPNAQEPSDLAAAAETMDKFRPYIRYIDTQRMIGDLANGEICVAIGYSGDMLQAHDRAIENKTGANIAFVVPKEGSITWYDSYLIPKDAPHPLNAHAFINYMLRPTVIAAVTNKVKYANGVTDAAQFVDKAVLDNPGIYPPADMRARLVTDQASFDQTRATMTRLWTKFTTGH
jgi:putrescine transport system substrate-binding protein